MRYRNIGTLGTNPTRRDVVVGGAAFTLTGAKAMPSSAGGGATATGSVREPGPVDPTGSIGRGLPGVLVSNGRDVIRTDAEGRYSLPVAPGQTIFIIKPAGYHPRTDPQTGLARFSYVHDPAGSPAELAFRYGGHPATGPLPASIDFALERSAESEKFDVLLLTDPQPESSAEVGFIRDDVVVGLIGSDAAFGVTCGDIAFDDLSMYPRINDLIGRIGVPWWTIGGNHDLDFEAPDAARSRDTYKRVFGAPYYAFVHGAALFVTLDNVEYFGAATRAGDDKPNYRGHVSDDQLVFVKALLAETAKDTLIVLMMHIPLRTYLGTDASRCTTNAADLLQLLGDRPAVSFAGHTHSTEHHYFGRADGFMGAVPHHHHVLTAVSGSWWSGPRDHRGIASADSYDGTPNGYHVLSIDGTSYTTRFVSAAEPGRQMRISLETQYHQRDRQVEMELPMLELLRSPITASQVSGTRLVVNVFDGGPRTKVSFRIADRIALEMARVARPDPFVEQVYGRHPETIKKWVAPQLCSHLWVAPLPSDIKSGTYPIEVTATDEYGRRHLDRMLLEVL